MLPWNLVAHDLKYVIVDNRMEYEIFFHDVYDHRKTKQELQI